MTVARPQLHWSHVRMLLRCGEQYRRRYIEREIIPPGVAAVIGSGAHAGISMALQRKIETGKVGSLEEAQDRASDYVRAEFDRGAYRMTTSERAMGIRACAGNAVDWAVCYTGAHVRWVAPGVAPILVEHPWVLKLAGMPFDLAGRIDVIQKVAGDEHIRDIKTGKRAVDPWSSRQLIVYALARTIQIEQAIEHVVIDNLIRLANGVKVKTTWARVSAQDFQDILLVIERAAEVIDQGLFLPAQLESWWCDPRFCGYYADCPYVRGRAMFSLMR